MCHYWRTPFLDDRYTVFYEVERGLDVVEKIQNTPTRPSDYPVEDIATAVTVID
ncbi:MAG: peptidylprolyl isomerase [Prevotella sp.]